jgi:hypothetical protein
MKILPRSVMPKRISSGHGTKKVSNDVHFHFSVFNKDLINSLIPVQNSLISAEQASYHIAYRSILNPEGKPYTIIQGASAHSMIDALLCFDPDIIVNVDKNNVNAKIIGSIKESTNDGAFGKGRDGDDLLELLSMAKMWRHYNGWWRDESIPSFIAYRMFYELSQLGIIANKVQVSDNKDGSVELGFDWAYPGGPIRQRTVKFFFGTEIRLPSKYPAALASIIHNGAQAYFQKASQGSVFEIGICLRKIYEHVDSLLIDPETNKLKEFDKFMQFVIERKFARVDGVNKEFMPYFDDLASKKKSSTDIDPYYGLYLSLWQKIPSLNRKSTDLL